MGNLIPSNNNDDNLDFNPTKLPGCKVWLDASDESTLFTTDYQGSVTVPDNFTPTSVGGCATWFDSSDVSTLYSTSVGDASPVSSPTEINGCVVWLDGADSGTRYSSYAGPVTGISSPLDISGCQGWWDASDISSMFQDAAQTVSVANNSDPVAVLRDKSGANIHAIQSSSTSSRPTYTANLVGDKSGLFFDGINDFLLANRPASSTHTILAVLYPTVTLTSAASPISINSGACFHPFGGELRWFASDTGAYLNGLYNFDLFPQIVGWTNSSGVVTGYKNSYVAFSGTASSTLSEASGLQIGRRDDGFAYFTGYICEIVCYNKVLTTSERASIEQYFTNKWSISQIHGQSSPGSRVGYWGDKSGNNYHAKQVLEANRPSISQFPSTSVGSILFTKSQTNYLSINNYPFSNSSNFTFFIVFKPNTLSSNDAILGKNHSSCLGTTLWYASGLRLRNGSGEQFGLYNDLNTSILTWIRSSSTANSVFRNGNLLTSFNEFNPNSTSVSDLLSTIGSSCNGNNPYDGYIGEIIVFNRNLSLLERGRVEKYLLNKWSIPDPHVPTPPNGPIGCWLDKSGNNRHATQTIASYRPSRSGSVNGLQAITFDGTDDYFDLGNLSSAYPSFGEVFIVFEPNNATNYELYQTSQNYPIYLYAGSSFFGAFTSSRAAPGAIGAPTSGVHVTSMRANSTSMTVRLDGNIWHTQSGLGYNAGASHAIGYSYQGTGGVDGIVMNGKIVEVITYNTDIGAENRAKVEQYLAKKWGINSKLHDRSNDPGEKIGYWKNKTSLNFGVSQFNITKRPSVGFLNNKKAVSFDDINGQYLTGNIFGGDMLPNGECSFFWVANITTTAVAGSHVVFMYGNYNSYNLISKFDTKIEYGGGNGISLTTPPQTKNAPIIESVIKGNGTIFNATNAYRNGFLLSKSNLGIDSDISVGPTWLLPLMINAYNPYAFSGTGAMTIGEFIGYNRGVSDQERKLIEKYLHDKWNINALTTSISKPTDISGCSLWLDANDPKTLFTDTAASTNISADGQTIAYWADKVAGQDVIQATVAARPTYRMNMQNGRPMIYFDGGDDLLSQVNRPYSAPCTLFVVCRVDSATGGDMMGIFTYGNNTGGLGGPGITYNGSPGVIFLDGAGSGTASSSNTSINMMGLPRVITGIYSQSNTSNSSLYVNGNLEENFTGAGVSLTSGTNRVQIGARTGGGQNLRRMIGYIAECISYDRVLTDNERASVENYLSEKWGIGSYSSPNSIGSSIIRHKIKVSNKDAQNWIDRVFANGGSVSEKTADSVNEFCKQIESAGLRKKFYRLNLFCGNDLQACLTPLYLGPDSNTFYGNRTESNTGFVGSNYDEKNGLITNANGSYLLTGLTLSGAGLSDTGHMAFYQNQFNIDTNPYTAGSRPSIGAGNSYIILQGSSYITAIYGAGGGVASPYYGGLFVVNRDSSNSLKTYEQGILLGEETATVSIPDQTSQVGIFTSTTGSIATGANYYNAYVKGYSVGRSMTQQETSQYNTIMENFQTSLGRGLPVRASAQFSSVTNEETKSWIDAVYANGGTVSTATALAVNNFCNSMDSSGLRSKFYRLNLFCGNNLASCLVPLYRGPSRLGIRYGNARDINVSQDGYGYYANSDNFNYIENQGLLGNTQEIAGNSNVSRRYLNTGLITGSISQLNNNMHYAIYSKDLTNGGYAMGAYDAASTGFSLQIGLQGYNVGTFANALLNTTNTSTTPIYPTRKGLYVGNYSNYILNLYEGRANTVGQRDLTTTYALSPTTTSPVAIFGENRTTVGIALFNYLDRLQGYSMGASLTPTDIQNYYDIMQTFQTALSRAQQTTLSSTFDSITNIDARDWLTRVYENGGTVSLTTATAVQNLCNTINSSGLRGKFFRLNLFCGNNINAAMVPLYRGPSASGSQLGFLTDINYNFTNSDYNETGPLSGLKGDFTKYLDTGLAENFSQTRHLGVSITSLPTTPYRIYMGANPSSTYGNWAGDLRLQTEGVVSNTTLWGGNDAGQLFNAATISTTIKKLTIGVIDQSNAYTYSNKNISNGTTSFSTNSTATIGVFGQNAGNTWAGVTDARISMYTIGSSLSQSEVNALTDIISTFDAALSRNTNPSDSFTGVQNSSAKDWIDRVYYKGGSVSTSTASAVNALCNSIDTEGLRSRIYRLNLLCGNDLNAVSTPLFLGPSSSSILGSYYDSLNYFTISDYVETGSSGGLKGNGTNKYIETGLYPPDAQLTVNDGHISVYVNSPQVSAGLYRYLMGSSEAFLYARFGSSSAGMQWVTAGSTQNINIDNYTGHMFVSNDNTTPWATHRLYHNGVFFASNADPSSTSPMQGTITIFNNSALASTSYFDGRIGFYSVGKNMTSTQAAKYNSIIETFQTALSRGRPSSDPVFSAVANNEAKLWIDNVYANGGTVSQSTANAVNTFCNSIESAGIRNRFYRLNLFAGSNLAAALVPLYRGPNANTLLGNYYDINIGSLSYDDSNPSLSSKGIFNAGSSSRLDTGLKTTMLPSLQTAHFAVGGQWSSGGPGNPDIGWHIPGTFKLGVGILSNVNFSVCHSTNTISIPSFRSSYPTRAIASRTNSGVIIKVKGTNNTYTLSPETISGTITSSFTIFGYGDSSTEFSSNAAGNVSFYSVGSSLTQTEVDDFDNALRIFLESIGRLNPA